MTLFYWEWHLIPRWPLRSIIAKIPEKLLKDLVSWGSNGDCSLKYRFLGDASAFCPAHFGVLFCSEVLGCWYLKLLDPAVSGARFRTWGVFVCDIADSRSVAVLCMLYKIWCNPMTLLMVLNLDCMCQCGSHTVIWSHIGILRRRPAAETRSTPGLLFPSQCSSIMILLTPCSMVWDWRVSRAESSANAFLSA